MPLQHTKPQPKVTCTCEHCGVTFQRWAAVVRNGRGLFCSRDCANTGRDSHVTLICEQCGSSFRRWAAELRRPRATAHVYCSNACKYRAVRSTLPRMAVYAIVHIASGRLYIGATSNIVRRWSNHRWKLGHGSHENPHLQAAWVRDGASAFEFRILEPVEDATQLAIREQAWLDSQHSAEPAYGFNRNPQSASPRGRKMRPEVIEQMAARQRGFKHSAETRAKISAAAKRRYHASDPAPADERVTMVQLQFP